MLALAWRGVLRDLDRTILAILGMAIAAAILAGAIAIPDGFPPAAQQGARLLVGGDVLVTTQSLPGPGAAGTWAWTPVQHTYSTDLPMFFPGTAGVLSPGPATLNLPALARLPGIAAVYPDYALPALDAAGHQVVLRGRDPGLDARLGVQRFIRTGRALTASDGLAAVVDVAGGPAPASVTLRVPTLRGTVWDYGDLHPFTFPVVGGYAVAADEPAQVETPDGQEVIGPSGPMTSTAYWPSPDVWVPLTTWRSIWAKVASGATFAPAQVALLATSTLHAATVAREAALVAPMAIQVPQLVAVAGDTFAVQGQTPVVTSGRAAGMPLPLGGLTAAFAVAAAALIMAGTLLTVVAGRRREIGILKALGASPASLAGMVAGEAAGLALLGGALGFGFVRLVVTLILLAAHASAAEIVGGGLRDAGIVLGGCVAAALICALLPALEAARVSVAEVLRES